MSIKPDFEEHIEETPEKEEGEGFEIHGVDDFINAVLVMNILARVSLSWLRKLGGRRHLPAIFEDIRLIQKRSAEVKTYMRDASGKALGSNAVFKSKQRYSLFWSEIKRLLKRIQFFEQERQAPAETTEEAQNLAAFEAAEPKEKAMDK